MLIHELKLQGLLSFGPESPPISMQNLNILIGPNGSGKSNLLEAIALLRSSATKLTAPIRGVAGGGVTEWIWKGFPRTHASLSAIIDYPKGKHPLRHTIEFTESQSRFELTDERIENKDIDQGYDDFYFYYRFDKGRPLLLVPGGDHRNLKRESILPDESILSQRKDPDQFPELAHLSDSYSKFRLYREWTFGRSSVFRSPQPADLPTDRLEEDFANLGLFLNNLRFKPKAKNKVISALTELYAGLEDFDVRIKGGTVEVFLSEIGDFSIPASRLSDGTLRYLCLLAIICIEEPELGLHPDIIPKIADLIKEASHHTQLIVTTHSDILVDCMSDTPEAVVVFDKHDGQTEAKRLTATKELQVWLQKYRLGELWTRGELGGTRW
jgi:predicted ATPase